MLTSITKSEYLYKSFKEKLYYNRSWVLSTFSVADFQNKKQEQVVHRSSTYCYFVENGAEIIISDAVANESLYKIGADIFNLAT